MFGKRLRFVTMIGIAAGIPYVWLNEQLAATVKQGWNSVSQSVPSFSSSMTTADWSGENTRSTVGQPAVTESFRPATMATVHPLDEVVRFDVSPRWVTERWERVSTVRAEQDLVGLRVPLVSGTEVNDIAGSLTYYFNAQQQMRRLTLHGETGDERKLVDYALKHFGLLPEPSLGAGVYILRWNAKPMNVLRVTHAPVVRADAPHSKYRIEMEINDVHGGYGMSPEFREYLVPDYHLRKWGL